MHLSIDSPSINAKLYCYCLMSRTTFVCFYFCLTCLSWAAAEALLQLICLTNGQTNTHTHNCRARNTFDRANHLLVTVLFAGNKHCPLLILCTQSWGIVLCCHFPDGLIRASLVLSLAVPKHSHVLTTSAKCRSESRLDARLFSVFMWKWPSWMLFSFSPVNLFHSFCSDQNLFHFFC